jgi:hypothetical protein
VLKPVSVLPLTRKLLAFPRRSSADTICSTRLNDRELIEALRTDIANTNYSFRRSSRSQGRYVVCLQLVVMSVGFWVGNMGRVMQEYAPLSVSELCRYNHIPCNIPELSATMSIPAIAWPFRRITPQTSTSAFIPLNLWLFNPSTLNS